MIKSPKTKLVLVIEHGNPNEKLIRDSGIPFRVHRIVAGKFRRFRNIGLKTQVLAFKRNALNIRDIFFVVVGFFQGLGLMLWYRPKVVFSKGSYVSVPVTFAAAVTFRTIITHDSDSVPGLANRLVSRFTKKNAVGVMYSDFYDKSKTIYTGVPVSDEFLKRVGQSQHISKQEIGLPQDCEVLFIGGSTQGARVIDEAVERIVPKLLDEFKTLQVIHVFGRLNEDYLAKRYEQLNSEQKKRLHSKVFLNDQYKYAAAADLVITRAGATAMAEYGVLGKACIVVPAKHLVGGHQLQNSKIYSESFAAIVIPEDKLEEELYIKVKYLLQHKTERTEFGRKLQAITPSDAAERLAEVILGEM